MAATDMKLKKYLCSVTELRGYLGEDYDILDLWEKAHTATKRGSGNAENSPHGMFRMLKNRANNHAFEFLQEFGPLGVGIDLGPYVIAKAKIRVDLEQFWRLHAEYVHTLRVYEYRNDKVRLSGALEEYFDYRPLHSPLRQNAQAKLEMRRPRTTRSTAQLRRVLEGRPAYQDSAPPVPAPFWSRWYSGTEPDEILEPYVKAEKAKCLSSTFEAQQQKGVGLVARALVYHTRRCGVNWDFDETNASWKRSLSADSLWAAMWDLFASDTTQLMWRICPHCQRLFYPPRDDRFYCTSREQVLASKRQYIQRVRAEQKSRKLPSKETER